MQNSGASMPYFDEEIKVTLSNLVAGAVLGYVSFRLNSALLSLLLAVVAFLALSFAAKRAFGVKKERKWWLSPVTIFFLSWLVSWTVFYNL